MEGLYIYDALGRMASRQAVTYTGFDKVSKVKQGTDSICYTYGYDHQRIFMEEHVGNTTRTKRYVGNCEFVTESDGNSTTSYWLTYLKQPKNKKILDELGRSLRSTYEARGLVPKGSSGIVVGNKVANRLFTTSSILGSAGVALVGVDIYLNDGIAYPSHLLDASVGMACIVAGPPGWIIGASYLAVDIGSYAFTGQSFGQHLNDWCGGYGFDFKTWQITP